MKYLKLFANHSDYNTAKNNLDKPNVSHCIQENEVHYNPWVETRLVATYNVEDASNPTPLFAGSESIGFPASAIYDKIEIGNEEIDMSDLSSSEGEEGITVYSYNFESGGQHTVKYTLKNQTMIGMELDEETGMLSKIGATFVTCPITSVEIPDSVTSIGQAAFNRCASLQSVTIPNSVTTIGDSAFYNCTSLTSVTIPNSVTSIGQYAFSNCWSLTSIAIPDNITSIENAAFQNCSGLTSVIIPDSVTSIEWSAFSNCGSLTSITIPDSVTSIGRYAFSNCSGLTNVTMGNGVTSIDYGAFYNCSGLTSVTIPDSVTSISSSAFRNCTSLTSAIIGSGVTSISGDTFNSCTSLTSITSLATTAPTIQSTTFQNVKTNGTLTVPSGSSGYDVWMGTGNYYLGKYNWTKVEQ